MRSGPGTAALGAMLAAVALGPHGSPSLDAQEGALAAAAAYVRSVVPEGSIRLNPVGFPELSALPGVAQAIGGDVGIGTLAPCAWDADRRRCVSTPDVRAYLTIQDLVMIAPDSATVEIELLEMPLEPRSPEFGVVARWVGVTVARRPGGAWEMVRVTMRAES